MITSRPQSVGPKLILPTATRGSNEHIGPEGDMHSVSAAKCTIRMTKAGAHVVCINRHFDTLVSLDWMKKK